MQGVATKQKWGKNDLGKLGQFVYTSHMNLVGKILSLCSPEGPGLQTTLCLLQDSCVRQLNVSRHLLPDSVLCPPPLLLSESMKEEENGRENVAEQRISSLAH